MRPLRSDGPAPATVHPDPALLAEDPPGPAAGLTNKDLVRYALYALAIVTLAMATAAVAAALQPKVYGTRTEILFERRSELSTGFLREDRNLTTQLVTLRSRAVLEPVASESGIAVEELAEKLDASIVDSSEVIRIQVDDRSPARGKILVDRIAQRYMQMVDPGTPSESQRFLQAEVAKVDAELAGLASAPSQPGTPAQTVLDAKVRSLVDQRSALAGRLSAATVDFINRPRVSQITQPYQLADPVAPRPLYAAAAGGLVGALVAAATVAALGRRRTSRGSSE